MKFMTIIFCLILSGTGSLFSKDLESHMNAFRKKAGANWRIEKDILQERPDYEALDRKGANKGNFLFVGKDTFITVSEYLVFQYAKNIKPVYLKIGKAVDILMNDTDENSRCTAAVELGGIKNAAVIIPLSDALKQKSPEVRKYAVMALHSLGQKKINTAWRIVPFLSDSAMTVRQAALKALKELAPETAVPPLTKMMNSKSDEDQAFSGDALKDLAENDVVSAHIALLQSRRKDTRQSGILLLRKTKHLDKMLPLLSRLINDPDVTVRETTTRLFKNLAKNGRLEPLAVLMSSGEEETRVYALTRLAKQRHLPEKYADGIPPLLKDKSAAIRRLALQVLLKTNNPNMLDHLTALLNDSNTEVRHLALHAIIKICRKSDKRTAVLTRSLGHTDPVMRETAVRGLAAVKHTAAVPRLLKQLDDKSRSVQAAAVKAIGELAIDKHLPAIQKLAARGKSAGQKHALDILAVMSRRGSKAALLGLAKAAGQPRSPALKTHALKLLGDTGKKEAVPVFARVLKKPHKATAKTALDGLYTVARQDVPEAVIALTMYMKNEKALLADHAFGLVLKLGNQALTALEKSMKSPNIDLKRASFLALSRIAQKGNARAVFVLSQGLKDKDWRIKKAVCFELGKIGSKRALPALTIALKDKDPEVRKSAELAIQRIQSR